MRPLLRELVPLFARTHDVTADIEFQLSAALKRAIQNGAVILRFCRGLNLTI